MPQITDNPTLHRFELTSEGHTAFITYSAEGNRLDLLHTEVPSALEGRGIGSALVRGTLDEIRLRNLKVKPTCPFVAAWLTRHPEYNDLL